MQNPCDKCQNRAVCTEYDHAYLQPVMLSKSKSVKYPREKPKIKKTNGVVLSKNGRPKPTGPCSMGGCPLPARTKGLCHACHAMVNYYVKRHRPVPTSLTSKQLAAREGKKNE